MATTSAVTDAPGGSVSPSGPPLPIFLSTTLDSFINNKEVKKAPQLKESFSKAVDCLKESNVKKLLANSSEILITPFLLVFTLGPNVIKSPTLIIMALDACYRIISHSQFPVSPILMSPKSVGAKTSPTSAKQGEEPQQDNSSEKLPLVDLVTQIIMDCYAIEGVSDEKIQLASIKVISAAVVSSNCPLHQSSLLNGIRGIYNIFLFLRNQGSQKVAHQTIKDVIDSVFSRLADAHQVITTKIIILIHLLCSNFVQSYNIYTLDLEIW